MDISKMQFVSLSWAFFQEMLLWSCRLRFCFHSLDVWEVLEVSICPCFIENWSYCLGLYRTTYFPRSWFPYSWRLTVNCTRFFLGCSRCSWSRKMGQICLTLFWWVRLGFQQPQTNTFFFHNSKSIGLRVLKFSDFS